MRVDYYLILAAVINIVLFLLHSQAYKSAGYSLRRSWASGTIGAGCGIFFYNMPEWLYGLSDDYTKALVAVVIWITGITMALVNLKTRN